MDSDRLFECGMAIILVVGALSLAGILFFPAVAGTIVGVQILIQLLVLTGYIVWG